MARINRDYAVLTANNTLIYKWNKSYLPLLPGHRTSLDFGWYSFWVPLTAEG